MKFNSNSDFREYFDRNYKSIKVHKKCVEGTLYTITNELDNLFRDNSFGSLVNYYQFEQSDILANINNIKNTFEPQKAITDLLKRNRIVVSAISTDNVELNKLDNKNLFIDDSRIEVGELFVLTNQKNVYENGIYILNKTGINLYSNNDLITNTSYVSVKATGGAKNINKIFYLNRNILNEFPLSPVANTNYYTNDSTAKIQILKPIKGAKVDVRANSNQIVSINNSIDFNNYNVGDVLYVGGLYFKISFISSSDIAEYDTDFTTTPSISITNADIYENKIVIENAISSIAFSFIFLNYIILGTKFNDGTYSAYGANYVGDDIEILLNSYNFTPERISYQDQLANIGIYPLYDPYIWNFYEGEDYLVRYQFKYNYDYSVKLNDVVKTKNGNNIFIGDSGRIYGTIDLTNKLNSIKSNTQQNLNKIYFYDDKIGYIVGDSGTILKTVNGGGVWEKQTSNTTNNLLDVHFTTSDFGMCVGESGECLYTLNGGLSWNTINNSDLFELNTLKHVRTFINTDGQKTAFVFTSSSMLKVIFESNTNIFVFNETRYPSGFSINDVYLYDFTPETTLTVNNTNGDGAIVEITAIDEGSLNNNNLGIAPILSGTGQITSISLIDGGDGYTVVPPVSIVGNIGQNATFTATLSGQSVNSVSISTNGTGYILTKLNQMILVGDSGKILVIDYKDLNDLVFYETSLNDIDPLVNNSDYNLVKININDISINNGLELFISAYDNVNNNYKSSFIVKINPYSTEYLQAVTTPAYSFPVVSLSNENYILAFNSVNTSNNRYTYNLINDNAKGLYYNVTSDFLSYNSTLTEDITNNDIPRLLILDYNLARHINLIDENDDILLPSYGVAIGSDSIPLFNTNANYHDVSFIKFTPSWINFASTPLTDILYYDKVNGEYVFIGVDGTNINFQDASLSKEFTSATVNSSNLNEITLTKGSYTNLATSLIVDEIIEFKYVRDNDNIKELGYFKITNVVDNGSTVTVTVDRAFDMVYDTTIIASHYMTLIPHNIFERKANITDTINNINNVLSTNYFFKDFYRLELNITDDILYLRPIETENSLLYNMSIRMFWDATDNYAVTLEYTKDKLYAPDYTLEKHINFVAPSALSQYTSDYNDYMTLVSSYENITNDTEFYVDGVYMYVHSNSYLWNSFIFRPYTFFKIDGNMVNIFMIEKEDIETSNGLIYKIRCSHNIYEKYLNDFSITLLTGNGYFIDARLSLSELSIALNITDKLYKDNYNEIKFNTYSYVDYFKTSDNFKGYLIPYISGIIYTNENNTPIVEFWNIEDEKNLSYSIDQLTTVGDDYGYSNFYTQSNDDITRNALFTEFPYKEDSNFTDFDGVKFFNNFQSDFYYFIVNNKKEVLMFLANGQSSYTKLCEMNDLKQFTNIGDVNEYEIESIKVSVVDETYPDVTIFLTCVNEHKEYVVITLVYNGLFNSLQDGTKNYITVIDKLNTPIGSPNVGDRFYVGDNPDSLFAGHKNEIAEWNGTNYVFLNKNNRERIIKTVKAQASETLGGLKYSEIFFCIERKLNTSYLYPIRDLKFTDVNISSNLNNITIEDSTHLFNTSEITPNQDIKSINNISKIYLTSNYHMYALTGKNNNDKNITIISRVTRTNLFLTFPDFTVTFNKNLNYTNSLKFNGVNTNDTFVNMLNGDVTDIKIFEDTGGAFPRNFINIANKGRDGGLNQIIVRDQFVVIRNNKKERITKINSKFKNKNINQIISANISDNIIVYTQYGFETINDSYYYDYIKTESLKVCNEPYTFTKGLEPYSGYNYNLIYSIVNNKVIKFNDNYRYELPKIERFKVDYKLVDGLTIDSLKSKGYDWILNAVIRNAVIGEDSNGLVWYSGDWICGTWYGGTWHSGTWHNGLWINGIWNSSSVQDTTILRVNNSKSNSVWRNGEWADGLWNNGTWLNGIFQNGRIVDIEWYKGIHVNGVWLNGHWMGGTWKNGTWYNGIFECLTQYSIWESGTWNGGDFYNGLWINGTFRQLLATIKSRFGVKASASVYAIWKNGVWKKGDWYSGMISDGVESDNYRYSIWYNGIFEQGTWYGGTWYNGVVYNITWYKGLWKNGTFRTGQWKTGVWENGEFLNGYFEHGLWKNGYFRGGNWLIKKPQPLSIQQ